MMDLTTLEGADTPGKVAALCSKAMRPDPADPTVPRVAAICVYPDMVPVAVDALRGGGPSWQHFAWFGLSISLFVYSFRYILYESTRITEAAICSVRLRLADKIRRSDLLALERPLWRV